MLFNSPEFIYFFLPIAIGGFYLFGSLGRQVLAAIWLVALSLLFYSAFNAENLRILLPSILANYWLGKTIAGAPGSERAKAALFLGVASNLVCLIYFKYTGFLFDIANGLAGTSFSAVGVILPLGISFFTFTQIAFLVDAYQGKAHEYRFSHYCLFVTYFPHLVAGPILHHKEMMPQFERGETYRFNHENISVGLTVFAIGLFKKVILADGIAPYANLGFGAAARGETLGLLEAWCAALSYTFQLYFDFSGYSDMAVGISRMFGIRLPINFYSPYKAVSIVEFWRRWHMTLSRFLRDYLYIPLGGNRKGPYRRQTNLMITMVLGGLWHGAGWTFVIWGGLHGIYLMVNHAWTEGVRRLGLEDQSTRLWWRATGWLITFIAVVVAWVFFRADTASSAIRVLSGMFGVNGILLPDYLMPRLGSFGQWLISLGIKAAPIGGAFGGTPQVAWILLLATIALLMPNSQQLLVREEPGFSSVTEDAFPIRMKWQPRLIWAFACALMVVVSTVHLGRSSEFLYWQF